jgi:transcriptional regulator with XRE-family HTH domain
MQGLENSARADVPARRRGRRGRGLDVRPDAVREARIEAGLTMAEVAGDEFTRGAIYLFESGRARPSREALELIARRTSKPLSFFLADGGAAGALSEADELRAKVELEALRGRPERVVELARAAIEVTHAPTARARLLLRLAEAEARLGQIDAGTKDASEARSIALQHPDEPWLEAEAQIVEAELLGLAGDPDAASRAEEALERARALEPPIAALEARAASLVVGHHEANEAWPEAAALLAPYAAAGSPPGVAVSAAAQVHEALAEASEKSGQRTAAFAARAQAAALWALHRDLSRAADAAVRLGAVELLAGDPEGARAQLEQALALAETLGLAPVAARALIARADLELRLEDLTAAGQALERARERAKAADDAALLGYVCMLEGRLGAATNDRRATDRGFREAIRIFETIGHEEPLAEVHAEYAEVLESRGNLKAALAHWKHAASHRLTRTGGLAGLPSAPSSLAAPREASAS